jgi:hypothetical protein
MKKKRKYSKHDLRRSIEELQKAVYWITERIGRFETVFNDYIEMKEDEEKFKNFIDGKYKQPERDEG